MGNPYESNKLVSEYLLFHYGQPSEILPHDQGPHSALDFAVRSVTEMIDLASLPDTASALDLGCAVGRSSFTLSETCAEVLGIDFSHAFVAAAQTMATERCMSYHRTDEGAISTRLSAQLPESANPERVTFAQGDATALPTDIGGFDVALLANLICRLPQPKQCLDRLPSLIRPGGQLIITSPYTWLDDFTPREHWLGGYEEGEKAIVTIDALTTALTPHFELMKRRNLPMLIREHARKYQWTVAEGSLWKRRSNS
ncbi:MAG: putative 4-mercaptohistidine N1-methyltransferase [Verrucomicrobiales bacterium]|jgi:putative 4-mercaptohistidine N1-methyltranferase